MPPACIARPIVAGIAVKKGGGVSTRPQPPARESAYCRSCRAPLAPARISGDRPRGPDIASQPCDRQTLTACAIQADMAMHVGNAILTLVANSREDSFQRHSTSLRTDRRGCSRAASVPRVAIKPAVAPRCWTAPSCGLAAPYRHARTRPSTLCAPDLVSLPSDRPIPCS